MVKQPAPIAVLCGLPSGSVYTTKWGKIVEGQRRYGENSGLPSLENQGMHNIFEIDFALLEVLREDRLGCRGCEFPLSVLARGATWKGARTNSGGIELCWLE
jgi:hypothetical protein